MQNRLSGMDRSYRPHDLFSRDVLQEVSGSSCVDEREITEPGAGDQISGKVAFSLPEGSYNASAYSPQTGLSSPAIVLTGGPDCEYVVPPFDHDCTLVIRKQEA